jgi:uncharacterized protein YybS (DUF2232 family)
LKNTKRLTEAAVLLAVFAVLLLISLYLPFLSIISIWFLPLPFIYIAWKNDWKTTLIFFIASIIISLIVGSLLAIPLTILYGTTGITLGYLVQRKKSRLFITIAATLVILANVLIQYGASVILFDINYLKETITIMEKSFDSSLELLDSMGKENEAKIFKEQFENMIAAMKLLLPSLLVISAFIIAYLLQIINFSLLKRFGIHLGKWKPFRELSLPRSIIWYYLATAILTLILKPEAGSYLHTALWNLAYILQILLVVQGLAFVYFFSYIKALPKAIPIIVTVLLFIAPLVLYIIRILGIIDLGFDLRKRLYKK